MADRRLRPLSLGDIFDEGFDLYKKNFAFLVLVTLVVTVPLDIIVGTVQVLYWHIPSNFDPSNGDDLARFFGPVIGPAGIALFVASLIYAAPLAALAAATSARYLGEAVTLRQAYRAPLRRLPALVGTGLLYCLILTLSLFLCFIGVVWPAVSLIFTAHAFALEGKSGTGAISRTNSLVSGHWLRVLGALILLSLVYFILTISVEVPLGYGFDGLLRLGPGGHSLFLPGGAIHANTIRRQVVDQLSQGLADLFLLPFVLSVLTVLYYDLRVRKEAFDVDVLVHDLGYPVGASPQGQSAPAPLRPAPALAAGPQNRGRL